MLGNAPASPERADSPCPCPEHSTPVPVNDVGRCNTCDNRDAWDALDAIKEALEIEDGLTCPVGAVVALKRERDEARRYGAALYAERLQIQADSRLLTCVWCGRAYPPGTPTSNHESLRLHAVECPQNPVTVELQRLRTQIALDVDGASIPLLGTLVRAIVGAAKRRRPAWLAVHELTGHGSRVSRALCRWACVDPDGER